MPARICADLPPLDAPWDPAATACEEVLLRQPGGTGHWWVQVEKRGLGTGQARQAVARAAGVDPDHVGCAGHRDRHARSTQWFSVSAERCEHPGPLRRAGAHGRMRVLQVVPGSRPVGPGSVARLRWRLTLKGAGGSYLAARTLAERLRLKGLPNRIGRIDPDLARWGDLLLAGRRLPEAVAARRPDPRRLLLAAQADRFNRWLDARIADGLLDQVVTGDRIEADGLHMADDPAAWAARVAAWSATVCGPLLGHGCPPAAGAAAEREAALWADLDPRAVDGLAGGVRPCRIHPGRMAIDPDGANLVIGADLPAEVFPDAILFELTGVLPGAAGED
ncbi:MAG: hypothetical protein RLZZ127_306 [Planctomycetota bacterium]|jgi:tRNA pseudouridine13 synthase